MNFGRHPLTPLAKSFVPLLELGMDMPGVEYLSQLMEDIWVNAITNLTLARDRFKSYADAGRKEIEYVKGQEVLLRSKYLRPVFGVRKLMPKYFGPFPVSQVVNKVAYRLKLPPYMGRIHDVFHVSLLEPYIPDGKNRTPPCPIRVGGIGVGEEWVVESVIDHRNVDKRSTKSMGVRDPITGIAPVTSTHHKHLQYRVKWAGFPIEASTWVGADMLIGHNHSLEHYWTQKWSIQAEMKALKRAQNKMEPEFDDEHWPWAETGGPVIDPHAPVTTWHPLDIALLGRD
jgi:hypothetical protein